jgi:hypothetical protein
VVCIVKSTFRTAAKVLGAALRTARSRGLDRDGCSRCKGAIANPNFEGLVDRVRQLRRSRRNPLVSSDGQPAMLVR